MKLACIVISILVRFGAGPRPWCWPLKRETAASFSDIYSPVGHRGPNSNCGQWRGDLRSRCAARTTNHYESGFCNHFSLISIISRVRRGNHLGSWFPLAQRRRLGVPHTVFAHVLQLGIVDSFSFLFEFNGKMSTDLFDPSRSFNFTGNAQKRSVWILATTLISL